MTAREISNPALMMGRSLLNRHLSADEIAVRDAVIGRRTESSTIFSLQTSLGLQYEVVRVALVRLEGLGEIERAPATPPIQEQWRAAHRGKHTHT